MKKVTIYDWELTANTAMYSDVDRDSDHITTFIIHEDLNQGEELVQYLLNSLSGQIGFNNKKFDSQVQQHLINNWEWLQFRSASEITQFLYEYAQKIITRQDNFDKFQIDYPDRELSIPQLDLLLIHHFDNVAKRQSLKGVQCNLNYWNVQEMPFKHDQHLTYEQVLELKEYNKNDILSTKALLAKTQKEIELRKELQKLYNIPCLNWSDSKIGEELVFRFYCEYTKQEPSVVKKLRTEREVIKLSDCILPSIKFQTDTFNNLKKELSEDIVYNGHTKKDKKIFVNYKGLEIDYGKGGIHASLQGVFEEDDEWMIYDVDVTSLYPSIAIVNNFYPDHLGPEFVEVYKEKIVDMRIREKNKGKAGNKAIVLALKNAANSVYGKSNSEYSFLYDPYYTLLTTLNGQLQLSMLAESIGEALECTIIQLNTDGASIRIKRKDEQQFLDICKQWEIYTKLSLEYVTYKRMYIRDVNNYAAVKKDEVKLKGCFEKDKPLHKDCSFRIIPLALEAYVANDIPVKETVEKHDKIWDFLGRIKFQKNMHGSLLSLKNGRVVREETQKVTRYFVSKDGAGFEKIFDDGRVSSLEKDFLVTTANIVTDENAFNYNINRRYYIKECLKIIDAVESEYSKVNGKKKKVRDKDQLKLL